MSEWYDKVQVDTNEDVIKAVHDELVKRNLPITDENELMLIREVLDGLVKRKQLGRDEDGGYYPVQ